MAVFPSNMAPIGVKLWENALQMIPDISFFDVEKNFSAKFFDKKIRQIFFLSWLEDTCVLARRHMCPGQQTHVSWLEDTCLPAGRHMCPG